MQTITVDIINKKALKLLQDLENLQLIRLRKNKDQDIEKNQVDKYKGAMNKQTLSEIDQQLNDLRNGWE
ncbi:MAG: hypothetical protein CFE21_13775 [Bacteroidetes bacterium B1(2017)]|nr:MAG: hypothetical protein CFE21_13775 [Bacteroidetes bacterium B1(2017)]